MACSQGPSDTGPSDVIYPRPAQRQPIEMAEVRALKSSGQFTTGPLPTGLFAFRFGMSIEEALRACGAAGGKYTAPSTMKGYCSENLRFNGDRVLLVTLRYCEGMGLCNIMVVTRFSLEHTFSKYLKASEDVRRQFGLPSHVTYRFPADCNDLRRLTHCLDTDRAKIATSWFWSEVDTITIMAVTTPDGGGVLFNYARQSQATAHARVSP